MNQPGHDHLKQRKEDFVSGLTGGPVLEIYICTLVAASSYLAWSTLQSKLSFFKKPTLAAQFLDISLSWFTPLLSITLYSATPATLNALILAPAIALLCTYPNLKLKKPTQKINALSSAKTGTSAAVATPVTDYLPKLPFLTVYRGCMMVLTCLAILAVDFKIFPRRFAKVETWGFSLMDLGVGSFVFSMGIVSARSTLVDALLNRETSRLSSVLASFRQAFAVLTLGALRLILVKSLDYQEHVTEYGVHWNFFITLGLLPPFVSLIDMFPKKIPLAFVALTIGVLYEFVLNKCSLIAYIIAAPRDNLFSQNREGIFSFIGYLSIFLMGKSSGYYILPSHVSLKSYFYPQSQQSLTRSSNSGKGTSSQKRKAAMLFATGMIIHLLYYIARTSFRLASSRRFANLCYILCVTAYNLTYLSVFVAIESFVFGSSTSSATNTDAALPYEQQVPFSLESVNANGLAIFLLANISTGLINITFNTIDASKEVSVAILIIYASGLALASIFLKRRGIMIKI